MRLAYLWSGSKRKYSKSKGVLVMLQFFKSILDQDGSPVVVCDLQHKILYMNPVAVARYGQFGGEKLLGKSLLDCHNSKSGQMIHQVLDWFRADCSHNRVHTAYNEQENKDVYMVALRNEQGTLIGYYEKHEYRQRDTGPLYSMDGIVYGQKGAGNLHREHSLENC